jgi:GNAT superfamily N-acetyltransferase
MTIEVLPLGEEHVEAAAALVSKRYAILRDQVPLLPPRYGEVSALLPLLHGIVGAGPGVAAIRHGRLVGFLGSWMIPSFRGSRAAFSPEWANAAEVDEKRLIYEEMYTQLSALWAEGGCLTHLIGTLVNDGDAMDVWHWLGFGMIAADAVRDLQPVAGTGSDVNIRRGGREDIGAVMELSEALQRHMASAPTFLVQEEHRDRCYYEEWLADPANALWLADDGTEAVAFMKQGPANTDACTIICDEKTSSIVGAFTKDHMRGRGIASALLNRALAWARSAGYERCAVDFEPMNPLATRFWLRHFQPVCYTLVRHVDHHGT